MEHRKERFPNVSRRLFPLRASRQGTTVSRPSSSSSFQSSPLSTRPRRPDRARERSTLPSLPPLPPPSRTSDSTPSGRSSSCQLGAAALYARTYDHPSPNLDTPSHDDDGDVLNETILAIDMKEHGLIGCAYYVAIDESLSLQEDLPMAGADFAETLVMYAKPTTVLISSKAPVSLVSVLEAGSQGLGEQTRDRVPNAYILRTISAVEFNYEGATEKLLSLDLETLQHQTMGLTSVAGNDLEAVDEDLGQKQGRILRLSTVVHLDSRLSIGCAGAILGEIQRRRAIEFLPNDPNADLAIRVRSLKMLMLSNSMFVNADTLESLQILRNEYHPNGQMRGPDQSKSGSKESLSVYGLIASAASTSMGKDRLRQMFLRPTTDFDTISDRQRAIAALLQPENAETTGSLRKMLRKVKNIKLPLQKLRKGALVRRGRSSTYRNVWLDVSQFAMYTVSLRQEMHSLVGASDVAALGRLLNAIDVAAIQKIGNMITAIIDLAESKVTGRSCINTGVSNKLEALRRDYDGLSTMLVHVARGLVTRVPEWARPHIDACIFYPQLGFLTVVFLNPETGKGKYEGEGLVEELWESMFVDGDKVYYKNATMRELDQVQGNVYVAIQDEEIEIAQILALKVLGLEDALIAANDTCGELDSFLALAASAEMYNWTAPCMENENVIQIEGGRHALQELAVSSFIENDCRLAGGPGTDTLNSSERETESIELDPRMLVLTGPNHSGKSVYLKQVALIVFLAHIGSYVPARRAVIGFTDRLLTRVSTRESISCEGSAFAIDLRQAAFAINFATRRSLVIVDEFGKGTSSLDGAGLCAGLLDHFLGLGREAPKALFASHFHEVFENGFLDDTPGSDRLAFAHMDVRLDENAANPEDEIVYLFRLVPGRSTSSLGSHCAAMNGVQPVVVERAEALVVLLSKGEDLEAACMKLTTEEEGDLEEAETTARHLLAWSSGGTEEQTGDECEDKHLRKPARSIRDELRQILLLDADQVAGSAEGEREDSS